jgi:2-polyprenyl-3-methyl-5-hydroxy-6-metoxy-1,4-benzoquinol methylase
MEKNTPELWDNLWKETSEEEDKYNLSREENSIRWQRIEKEIKKNFKDFKNLKVIEVGAGGGTNCLLFAKRKAKVTILDFSKNALKRSKEFFKRNNCKADFILADALKLPKKLEKKYDVSMSFGLVEHFKNDDRKKIIKSHFDLIKDNGLVIISVPNKSNFPYRIHKLIMQSLRLWKFGEEYPYSRKEFRKIADSLKIKKFKFLGDSFFKSFRYINPFLIFKKNKKDLNKIKKEKGSFLDKYFSYTLVFLAKKI